MVKLSSSATRIYEDKSQIGSMIMASPVFDNRLNKMLEINVYHKLMIVNLLSRVIIILTMVITWN